MAKNTSSSKKHQIAISFDTTGSMYPCLTQVRNNVAELIKKLTEELPGCEIGIIAHGDYCDGKNMIKSIDLTSNAVRLVDFVKNVPSTDGGDTPECYEYVLHEAQKFSWDPKANKIFIMIGDSLPHAATAEQNTKHYDWRKEAKSLHGQGVSIYSVQALGYSFSRFFYKELAEIGGGYHLELDQFSDIEDLLLMVTYRQVGKERVERFEHELEGRGKMTRSKAKMFATLLNRDIKTGQFTGRHRPLGGGRFQVMDVPRDVAIEEFVKMNGLEFKRGRGFYELTKRVLVQDYKEVILMDKKTGDLYTGTSAREMAGLPVGVTANVSPVTLTKYRIFIQSTSNNRKLLAGTGFLYEVPDFVS